MNAVRVVDVADLGRDVVLVDLEEGEQLLLMNADVDVDLRIELLEAVMCEDWEGA